MSMIPARRDFIIPKGTDWSRLLEFRQTSATGAVTVLTGYTARMQIRTAAGGTMLEELTTENGGISISGAAGQITLTLTDTETAAISVTGLEERTVTEYINTAGKPVSATGPVAVYDLEIISAGGLVDRPIYGFVCLTEEVTA